MSKSQLRHSQPAFVIVMAMKLESVKNIHDIIHVYVCNFDNVFYDKNVQNQI